MAQRKTRSIKEFMHGLSDTGKQKTITDGNSDHTVPAPKAETEPVQNQFTDSLWWSFRDGVLTIGGAGDMPDISYGSTYPWNQYRDAVVSVIIQRGVTRIGGSAFKNCRHLSQVILPEGLREIGYHAFEFCGIEEIVLPQGLKCIESSLFCACQQLTKVIIPDSVIEIKYGAFYECRNLSSLMLPKNLKMIGSYAFYRTGIQSISLPEGLICIEDHAFCAVPIKEVTIPDSVVDIDPTSFEPCKVHFPKGKEDMPVEDPRTDDDYIHMFAYRLFSGRNDVFQIPTGNPPEDRYIALRSILNFSDFYFRPRTGYLSQSKASNGRLFICCEQEYHVTDDCYDGGCGPCYDIDDYGVTFTICTEESFLHSLPNLQLLQKNPFNIWRYGDGRHYIVDRTFGLSVRLSVDSDYPINIPEKYKIQLPEDDKDKTDPGHSCENRTVLSDQNSSVTMKESVAGHEMTGKNIREQYHVPDKGTEQKQIDETAEVKARPSQQRDQNKPELQKSDEKQHQAAAQKPAPKEKEPERIEDIFFKNHCIEFLMRKPEKESLSRQRAMSFLEAFSHRCIGVSWTTGEDSSLSVSSGSICYSFDEHYEVDDCYDGGCGGYSLESSDLRIRLISSEEFQSRMAEANVEADSNGLVILDDHSCMIGHPLEMKDCFSVDAYGFCLFDNADGFSDRFDALLKDIEIERIADLFFGSSSSLLLSPNGGSKEECREVMKQICQYVTEHFGDDRPVSIIRHQKFTPCEAEVTDGNLKYCYSIYETSCYDGGCCGTDIDRDYLCIELISDAEIAKARKNARADKEENKIFRRPYLLSKYCKRFPNETEAEFTDSRHLYLAHPFNTGINLCFYEWTC